MIKITRFLIITLFALSGDAQIASKFDFGAGKATKGHKQVLATDVYSTERGYGFEPGATVTCSRQINSHSCTSDKPFYFSVALPEGNYRVTIAFGGAGASSTTVKAELRRLMLERVETSPNKIVTRSFVANVRQPMIPTGDEVKLKDREKTTEWWAWDEKLTLEFNNAIPMVSSIDIETVQVPTIVLLGDSTVCDQPLEPYASWGQMLTRFFDDRVAIANHAESGESLRSSLGAKRLDKVLSLMKSGDYLFIQYGHNDEKEKGDGIGAFTSYKRDLKYFVAETRRKGGVPILITPVQRRSFDANGKITNSHGDYPDVVRQVSKEENVPLIDLNLMSKDLYETLGPERSGLLFKEGDGTHHNNYGAYELAKCIVEAIRDQKLPLAKYLINGLPRFDPKKPDPVESFSVPASPASTNTSSRKLDAMVRIYLSLY